MECEASELSLSRGGGSVTLDEVREIAAEKAQVLVDHYWYCPGTNARGAAPALAQVSAERAWALAGHEVPVTCLAFHGVRGESTC